MAAMDLEKGDSAGDIRTHEIIIVGAGFGGIITALHLLRSGRRDFVILERAASIGGTWRDNTYPGCACDVPSVVYSIEGEPNPGWSHFFSGQAEILSYMHAIVKKHGLETHIRYGADFVQGRFDKTQGRWELRTRDGRQWRARVLVPALGPLNRPVLPTIEGRDDFGGPSWHSGEWNHAVDLRGKRVAVIGTGASAIQVIPSISKLVQRLEVFQRTPAWISARNNREVSASGKRMLARMPWVQGLARRLIYGFMEWRGGLFIGRKGRQRFFTRQCLKKLAREVSDPETRQKLTPGYQLGCKRILSSDDYLPTFNLPHVSLHTEPITRISPQGLHTADGKLHEVDVIIYCTGFEASEFTTDMRIEGLAGRELFEGWRQEGMQAHKGTTITGFPNLLYVLGPNTGLGHHSILIMMEAQMPYILQYLDLLEAQGPKGFLDVLPKAQAAFNARLQADMQGTVWFSGCRSWYLDSKGRNTTLYPNLTKGFRVEMANLDSASYVLHSPSNS